MKHFKKLLLCALLSTSVQAHVYVPDSSITEYTNTETFLKDYLKVLIATDISSIVAGYNGLEENKTRISADIMKDDYFIYRNWGEAFAYYSNQKYDQAVERLNLLLSKNKFLLSQPLGRVVLAQKIFFLLSWNEEEFSQKRFDQAKALNKELLEYSTKYNDEDKIQLSKYWTDNFRL